MYLVVGGTGRIGGEVVRLLAAAGERVRALVRDPFKASRLARPGVELVQGDLSVPASLPGALAGVNRVFMATPSSPDMTTLQTAMIRAARAADIERLVRVSAHGVGTELRLSLLVWHETIENTLLASEVPAVNLRPTSLMQNLIGSAETIRRAGQFFGTQGDGRIAVVDARDVAAAGVAALTAVVPPAEAVALTGPAALSNQEMAETLTIHLGRPVAYVDLPAEVMRQGWVGAGLPEWLVEDLVTLETANRRVTMPVTDGVARLTGRPARSFAEFVRDHRALFS